MKKKELTKNTIILLIGKFCTQFISFFLLPLYTSLISTAEYGTIDLLTTYISLLAPVLTLQLENAVFRFLIDARGNEKEKNVIITNTMITMFISIAIFILIYSIIIIFFKFKYMYMFPIALIITILSSIFLQISRGLGDNINYAIGSVIAGAGTVLFNVLFLLGFKLGAISLFLSLIFANLLCVIYIFIAKKLYKNFSFKFKDKNKLKEMLKYSIPLIPNGIIWWIIGVSDRTIVTFVYGASLNGIYAIAKKFSNLVINIYGVFNMSWTESISTHINEDTAGDYISEIFKDITNFAILICSIIILGVGVFFEFLIDSSYGAAYQYIPLLFLGAIFNIVSSFLGSIYIATKKTSEVAKTSILAGIINIVVDILLIKSIGLYAACISTILSFIAISIYRLIDLRKTLKISLNLKAILFYSIIFAISCGIFTLANKIIMVIILIILSAFFVGKYGKLVLKKIRKRV